MVDLVLGNTLVCKPMTCLMRQVISGQDCQMVLVGNDGVSDVESYNMMHYFNLFISKL